MIVAGVTVLLVLGGGAFLGWLGLPAGSTSLAGRYLAIVLPALPAMMLIHVGVAALRGSARWWRDWSG